MLHAAIAWLLTIAPPTLVAGLVEGAPPAKITAPRGPARHAEQTRANAPASQGAPASGPSVGAGVGCGRRLETTRATPIAPSSGAPSP